MRVTLATAERRLFDLCMDVLVECYPNSYELSVAYPDAPLPQADVYIWDYDDSLDIEDKINSSQPPYHIVVLDSQYLGKFKTAIESGTMVVLKPATKGALSAWLGQAMRQQLEEPAEPVQTRERYIQMLTEANIRLQQIEHERMQVFASALHDFRVPLTTTRGYCGILLNQQAGPILDSQRQLLGRMQYSLQRISEMAAAAFRTTIGRADAQRPGGYPAGDIEQCVKRASGEIQLFADEKRIHLDAMLDTSPALLHFDRIGIERVLVNLLHNACKATPRDGAITVKGYPYFWERRLSHVQNLWPREEIRAVNSRAHNSYRIEIHNTGPKIADDRLSENGNLHKDPVFSFEHGLGLEICKLIIEQHSGRIWAENRFDGPVITFVLPFRSEHAPMIPKNESSQNEALQSLSEGAVS
jgi:signal transduction histidine kinase